MKTLKKGIALSLALMLCLSLTSVNVWAAGSSEPTESSVVRLNHCTGEVDEEGYEIWNHAYYDNAAEAFAAIKQSKPDAYYYADHLWLYANTDATVTLEQAGGMVVIGIPSGDDSVTFDDAQVLAGPGLKISTVNLLLEAGEDYSDSKSVTLYTAVLDPDTAPVKVVKPDGTTYGFSRIYAAMFPGDVQDGDTIILQADIDVYDNNPIRGAKGTVTIDLNGHTLTNSKGGALGTANGKSLIIKDSVGTGQVTVGATIRNAPVVDASANATIKIEGGTFVAPAGSNKGVISVNNANGKVEISEGTIQGSINVLNGSVEISGGTLDVKAAQSVNGSTVKVTNAEEVTLPESIGLDEDGKAVSYAAKAGEVKHATLDAAIAAATAGQTVTLLSDASLGKTEFNKNLILDLGDRTLTLTAAEALQAISGGDVTVKNGTIRSDKDDIISAKGGKITLGESLTVEAGSSAIYAYESGTVIIDGADVTSTSTEYAAAFATGSGSAIDVKSGSLKQTGGDHVTLSIGGGASSTISGGEVYNNASSTVVAVGSTITITGGKVWNNVESPAFCAAYSKTGGKIIVSGGEVASTHGAGLVATKDSAVEVRGGTVKSVIAHEGNATATISGGTINGYVSAGSSNAGANNKAEITGGTVLGFLTAVAEKGTITVSGGWFSSKVSGSCLAGGLTATDAISNAPTPAAPYTVGTAYTVTYVDGQGNTLNTFTVLENSSTPTVGNPTRSGFIFSSWSPTVAGTVTANATYTAQWTVILPAPSGTGDEDNGEEIDLGEQETPLSEIPLLFADVTAGDRYRDAVAYVYSKGLMNGYSATTFAPAKSTTRAQIAAILMRLDDGEAPEEAVAFSDVKGGAWYAGAVAWAAENGIMSGYGNGAFGTTDKITREQLVTVLYRYAAGKGYDVSGSADLSVFSDAASVHRYALAAMAWAVDAGILELDGDRIDPTGAAARAEVAEILMRFCEGVAKDGEAELI